MANYLIPVEERNLSPQEVDALDRRRRRGQLFLVLCFQCLIVGTLVVVVLITGLFFFVIIYQRKMIKNQVQL